MTPRIVDCPRPEAPHPFAPSPLRWLVHRTAGGFSRLAASSDELHAALDACFEMGYTNLWIMRRELLLVRPTLHDYSGAREKLQFSGELAGRWFLFGDDGSKLDYHTDREGRWVCGFETLAEAQDARGDEALAAAPRVIVAQLIEDLFWH
jgi:hypothetical protein